MSETMTEEETQQLQTAKLIGYGEIFSQLLESERFREMFDTFFTLQKYVDDEERVVTFQVIENPPEVVAQKMAGKGAKAKPEIEVVSGSVAAQVVEKAKRGAKR